MRKRNAGVTLMELLTVVLVIGILAAVAIPSYGNYTRRASRADAKTALLAVSGQLERCFTRFNSYVDEGCGVVLPMTSTEGKYQISAPTLEEVEFVLRATPVAGQGQERDTECGRFTLDSSNARGNEDSAGVAKSAELSRRCWGR